MKKNEIIKKYLSIYTVIFCFLSIAVFFVFLKNGVHFISNEDGINQHLKAYIFYGEYLRTIVKNIVSGNFTVPQWSYAIGEGADIIQTFSYYVIGDIFALPTIFIPSNYMYLYYDFSVLFRIYCAGITFGLFCFYKNKNNLNICIIGSLMYSFCFWNLHTLSKHIYFLNPLIFLPLVLIGVEKILNNESKSFFIISVFISALSNIYFFYMIVVITVVYVIVRLIVLYGKDYKLFANYLWRITYSSIIAVLCAAFLVFPVLYTFLSNNRVGTNNAWTFVYEKQYYINYFKYLAFPEDFEWTCLGFTYLSLIGAIYQLSFGKNKSYKILFFISIFASLIPAAGQFMNCLSYVSNRWSWVLAFVMCYGFVLTFDNFDKEKLIVSTLLVIIYEIISSIFLYTSQELIFPCLSINVLIIVLLVLFIFNKKDKVRDCLVIMILIINILSLSVSLYSENSLDYTNGNLTKDEIFNNLYNDEKIVLDELNNLDRYSGRITKNDNILNNISNTQYYWTIAPNGVSEYRRDLGLVNELEWDYLDYNDRPLSVLLNSVNYYVQYSGEKIAPQSFENIKTVDNYELLKSEISLPIIYVYDETISYSDWKNLNPLEKEECMTQYLVLNNGDKRNGYSSNLGYVKYDINENDTTEIGEKSILNYERKSDIKISFDNICNCQLYLVLEELKYEPFSDDTYNKKKTYITVMGNDRYEEAHYYTDKHKYYEGETVNRVFNMGYVENEIDSLVLQLDREGIYNYKNLYIVCDSLSENFNRIQKHKIDDIENLTLEDNRIRFSVDLKSRQYLCFSIPYSIGWKAYVDGQKTELYCANIKNMALLAETGNHDIELRYETPLLKVGATISIVTIIGCIIYSTVKKKR